MPRIWLCGGICILLALGLVACASPQKDLMPTVDALKTTISALETELATLTVSAVSPTVVPTIHLSHQAETRPTILVSTPKPVLTMKRPPTATPSPTASPTPTITPTATPLPDAAVGDILTNLRSGPSVSFRVVAEVPSGTPLSVLGKSLDGEWIKVMLPDQVEGWMYYLPLEIYISPDTIPVLEQ